jgi:hypothetical protein
VAGKDPTILKVLHYIDWPEFFRFVVANHTVLLDTGANHQFHATAQYRSLWRHISIVLILCM